MLKNEILTAISYEILIDILKTQNPVKRLLWRKAYSLLTTILSKVRKATAFLNNASEISKSLFHRYFRRYLVSRTDFPVK